ncbi:MFS transporter [Curtobacterium sp. MCJR17_020]|uniref:MFS transporter n=1 Tax=Curtobacterium sp. MCJR17_020 TaxID=2175619 RepID=UPI000DA791F2|nr:MFS transporter [Curtobacterium sp. MCJR17_020]WIE73928.1 MFS transporter [Curtobacterium sp. MCJR17_020]
MPGALVPERLSSGWVLALTAAAQFVLQLDFAIVNVALPTVQRDLGFTEAGLQWVVTGYALTFGALLLVGGRFGDLIGYRRAVIGGLALFALTSLSGGLATGGGVLVASRMVQGASAALIAPAALALLAHAHPEPRARIRAMGIFQGSVAAGASAGIVLGGVLTQYVGWRSVLLINPPLILVLIALILWRVPAIPGHSGIRLDLPGALTATGATAALILGVSQGQQNGFGSPSSWIALVAAAVLAVAFVAVERRIADPMLPFSLLRGDGRPAALVAILVIGAVLAGYVYFVSMYLQRVLAFSALQTGLALVPATLTAFVVSTQVARRVLPRLGFRRQLLLALLLVGAGQLWLSQVTATGSYVVNVLAGILLTAAGMGLALPAASLALTAEAPPHQHGIAGALFASGQQVGSAIGIAVLATIAAASTDTTGDLVSGYRLSFLVATGLIALAVIATAVPRTRRTA